MHNFHYFFDTLPFSHLLNEFVLYIFQIGTLHNGKYSSIQIYGCTVQIFYLKCSSFTVNRLCFLAMTGTCCGGKLYVSDGFLNGQGCLGAFSFVFL